MKARPYQADAEAAIFAGLAQSQSQLLVMATGLGKTIVMSHVARRWAGDGRPGRVLLVAHREELIAQGKGKLDAIVGTDCDVEMAGDRDTGRSPVVVASVQSLSQAGRLARYRPEAFGLVMIDEAHHAIATTYRRVMGHFRAGNPACRFLGVTATPRRADELAMGQVFDSCCFEYGIEPAVEDGWLVPVAQRAVKVEGLDFSKVRQTAGDLNEKDLEKILKEEKVLHAQAAPTVEIAGDRPTLVFCVTVAHAHALAGVIDRYKPRSAVALDGRTDRDERRRQVERFKNGEVQFLVNVGLFLEGFDAPNTAVVAMCRPTKSLALYMQVLGRGTRPLPGVVDGEGVDTAEARKEAIAGSAKTHMTVLDFVGNSGRHKIVTAMDVLGGKYGAPAKEYARQLSEQDRERPIGHALEQAGEDLAFLAEIREMERRRQIKARATYRAESVSPFQGGRVSAAAAPPAPKGDPATDRQVKYLIYRAGWRRDAAAALSKRQASAIIGRHRESEGAVG